MIRCPYAVPAVAVLAFAALFSGAAVPVHAQTVNGIPAGEAGLRGAITPKDQRPAPAIAPSALPGAQSGPKIDKRMDAAGMSPNDALFDAVNRGDIGSAREALNRGADVDAHNVLGLTPVELSVDLGRNDITFLLLSMRGSGSAGRSAPPPGNGRGMPAARVSTGAPAPHPRAAAPVAMRQAPPRPVASANPVPGTDPGVPSPQAGFLGFGAHP